MTEVASNFTAAAAPGAHPQAGHGMELQTRPLDFLRSLHSYGDLVEIKMGPESAYVVCHPDLLHHVFTRDSTFDKGGLFYDKVRDTVGVGLGNCTYADHRRQRRLVQPAFTLSQLARYGESMEYEIDALVKSWQPGQVIDVYPVLHALYLRILARTVFSTQVDEDTVESIQNASKATLTMMVRRMSSPQPDPAGDRVYEEAHDYLNSEVERLIVECRRAGATSGDLLSMLITSRDEEGGTGLTDTEIRDHAINLFLAGSETPTAELTWALYLIAEHPEVREKLYAEVDAVLGAGKSARLDDVPNLPYTSRILTETLRMYPPTWMLTRVTTEPVEVAGRALPVGSTIVFSPAAVQHRADVYPRPDDFDPDRWIPGRSTTPPRSAFAAFGGGARRCIGENYTANETVMTLASIASCWRHRLAEGADVRPTTESGALRPVRLLVQFDPR